MDVASESWQDNLNHLPIDEMTSRNWLHKSCLPSRTIPRRLIYATSS